MIEESQFTELIQLAADISGAKLHELTPGQQTSVQKAAENRFCYRGLMQLYLTELKSVLQNAGATAAAVQPLQMLSHELRGIDALGIDPALFERGGMPFGLTKPIARLAAEGHAVGCASYLHEVVRLGRMISCQTVAGLFSILGHTGRAAESSHRQGRLPAKLSKNTIYQWYNELEVRPDGKDFGWFMRSTAKLAAFDALTAAEERTPTSHLPQAEARIRLAERIAAIASQTRVSAPLD